MVNFDRIDLQLSMTPVVWLVWSTGLTSCFSSSEGDFRTSVFSISSRKTVLNTKHNLFSNLNDTQKVNGVRVWASTSWCPGLWRESSISATWDIDIVLEYVYLSSLPENVELPLTALTHKLAMPFALCSANRYSELAALDLNFCSVLVNGIRFVIPGLTKKRRKTPPKEVILSLF